MSGLASYILLRQFPQLEPIKLRVLAADYYIVISWARSDR